MATRCPAERDGLRCDLRPHVAGVHMARPRPGAPAVSWPTEAHAVLERLAGEMRAAGLRCVVGMDGRGRACLSVWRAPARSVEDMVGEVVVAGRARRSAT
ncbi:MAG: hypothetical protein Q8Q14_00635 [Gemmatimonadales bacterium]|nr:hypothetical protein [Gemmatimonadales bacterium]